MTQTPWWHKDRHADRRPFLLARNKVKSALRQWFEGEGFTEVECGALQVSPGNETHLHAFATEFLNEDGTLNTRYYLHTSPEFASKKLLAAGETQIFDFARVYRNRESSPTHSPEFTMLEWYRTGASLDDIMEDCANILQQASEAAQNTSLSWKGRPCDLTQEPDYLTVSDAFYFFTRIDLDDVLEDTAAFAEAARKEGVNIPPDSSWSDIFSAVLVSRIEPNLGIVKPTFLYQYPLCEAALARPCPKFPQWAQRFELYVCGVELANGFEELTDPIEQRKRFEQDMHLKSQIYGERYPLDEDFLTALAHMPESAGVALGFDRLVMLCTGASRIQDVLWTPLAK